MTSRMYIPRVGEVGKVYYWSSEPGCYWSWLLPDEDPEDYGLHRYVSVHTPFVLGDCIGVVDVDRMSVWWEAEKATGHTRQTKRCLGAGMQGCAIQLSDPPLRTDLRVKFSFDMMQFVFGPNAELVPEGSRIIFANGAFLLP